MREIKFRAWDVESKRFRELGVMCVRDNGEVFALHNTTYISVPKSSHIIMQYTGLKDKNGKEIYESDLVKTPAGIGEIVWAKCFWLRWGGGGLTTLHDCEAEQLEVVGNKYETI